MNCARDGAGKPEPPVAAAHGVLGTVLAQHVLHVGKASAVASASFLAPGSVFWVAGATLLF